MSKIELITNMTDKDYFSHSYTSCSELKEFSKGESYYWANKNNDSESESLKFGKAFHKAILENNYDFSDIWKTKTTIDKNTEIVKAMRAKLMPKYSNILNSGINEFVILNHENNTRAKIDKWIDTDLTIYDFKTCQSIDKREIIKSIFNFKYHWQNAFYLDLLNKYCPNNQFVFIFIEKSEPYNVCEVRLNENILNIARNEYIDLIPKLWEAKNLHELERTLTNYDEIELDLDDIPSWLWTS
jgi:hypothetical protein